MGYLEKVCCAGMLVALSGMAGSQGITATHVDDFKGKPRVVVISDIGNEPDDQMSLTRFLLYSNDYDIEGLVAVTST